MTMDEHSSAPGSILKITASDFVSYEKLKFRPFSKLNILMAPNGAGKSSLLSAIILGLGGKSSVIGKSNQITDFIMYGKEEAVINLDLFDPESMNNVLKVTRVIKRNGTSIWALNQKKVAQKLVDQAMQRLNIMVDNLCQVLPQERVQDFAKMNSIELLDNIQKVLGGDLHCSYVKLKDYRDSLAQLKSTIDKKTQLCQDELNKVQRLEKDVSAIEEKKRVLKSMTHCQQKLSWILFNTKNDELTQVTDYLKTSETKLEDFEKTLNPLKKAINTAERKCTSLNEIIKNKKNLFTRDKENIQRLMNDISSSDRNIKTIRENLERRLSEAANCQEMIEGIEAKIHELAQLLAKENDKELTMRVNQFDHCIRDKNREFQTVVQQMNELKQEQVAGANIITVLEKKLDQANSVSRRRLHMLSTKHRDSHQAYLWLNQNRDKFQSKIYGPILMELNISNSEGAKYIEFRIPYNDLISFVTEESQDMTNLVCNLKQKEKLSVNCAHCPPPSDDIHNLFRPRYPIQQLRQLGFDCYLVDLLEGPPTVLKHLCNLYKLHTVPVAFNSGRVDTTALHQYNITSYFIGNQFYRVKTSKYTKNSSTSVTRIREAVFLSDSVDKKLIHQTQMELNAKREILGDLESEMAELERLRNSLTVEMNDLRNQKKSQALKLEQYRNTTVRLRTHEEERIRLMSKAVNQQREEATAQEKIKEILVQNRVKMEEILTCSRAYSENSIAFKLSELDFNVHKKNWDNKLAELTQHQEDKQKLKNDIKELQKSVAEVKAESMNLLSKAKQLSDGLVMGDDKFKKRFGKVFSTLPNDVDAIKDKLNVFEAKARCLDNPLEEQCLKDYETAKSLAESLSVELEKLKEELNGSQHDFTSIYSEWLPQIEQLVTRLNSRFSLFFQKMNCVGEVCLDKGEDQDSVDKFGLQIKVKFRNDTDLQVLDQYVQSGGERALTTAVFLLSLQRLSNLPFRCVDEINQGMDQYNERRVYNLLFNTISDCSSQYFLFTPKYLKGVSFPSICAVFGIFNCPIFKMPKHTFLDDNKENSNNPKRMKYSEDRPASVQLSNLNNYNNN